MSAASLVKIPIMLAALAAIEDGRLDRAERLTVRPEHRVGGSGWISTWTGESLTVPALLAAMIEVSDNAAANLLIDRIGFEAVNELLDRCGLSVTRLQRHLMDAQARRAGRDNLTSAAEQLRLLRLIAGDLGDAAGPLPVGVRAEAIALLARPPRGGRLAAGLPARLRLWHKTGELDGIRHDVGLVGREVPEFAVAVLVDGLPVGSEAEGQPAFVTHVLTDLWTDSWISDGARPSTAE